MHKLAFFDFCETLVNFQTADSFVDFVRDHKGNIYMKSINMILVGLTRLRIIAVLNRLFPDVSFNKIFKLLQIRNMTYAKLDHIASLFYINMIKPNLITPVMEEMDNLAKQDYELCLVSAGYSIYLKYFAKEYHIPHLISTEIAFDKSSKRCLGSISGRDCIGLEKVNKIKICFESRELNLDECISYSDSISDLPMLLLTGTAVVVSKEKTQPWCEKNKFREIIWE